MDSRTHSVQRLEVVDSGPRRRWSDDEKRRIVEEGCQGFRQVSATARRHGIAPPQLFVWRRELGVKGPDGGAAKTGFAPVRVVSETGISPAPRIEIISARGTRVLVDTSIDKTALAVIISALEDR